MVKHYSISIVAIDKDYKVATDKEGKYLSLFFESMNLEECKQKELEFALFAVKYLPKYILGKCQCILDADYDDADEQYYLLSFNGLYQKRLITETNAENLINLIHNQPLFLCRKQKARQ